METTHRWKLQCSILYFAGYTMLGCVISGLGPFIPFKAYATGQKQTDFGIVFTFRGIGYVIGSMGFAEMAEKYSSHKLMAISFALVGLMAFLAVNTERVMMMAILFFFSGSACAGIDVLTQSALVEVHEDKVGPWMQFLHFCFGMGAFISPLFLANMGGASYIVFGVASLILVVPSLWFKSPSIHKKTMKEDQNTNQLKDIPIDLHRFIMLGFFFYVGFEVGYGGWISTYGSMSGVATKEQAAYCSSIFWCFISIGRLLAVPFAIRYPTNIQFKILIYGCICSMLISNLLLLMNLTKLVIYGCSALYGLSMSAIYPLLISMPSYLKFRLSARNTSNYVLMGAFGESLMPVLLGYGISLIGPNTLFVASLVYAFILLFIYHQIMKFELSPVQVQLTQYILRRESQVDKPVNVNRL